ncbi:uncharacterized protein L969DRAFT_95343 [Mixia osmundae IAM 14324]|uniref:Extracellular membrane protein CFEM domain-containing protein n=1 Tax=Mixia osmundae (strain CBS 9802 / IAM 14324 / JCM 22182 / KY 12970) TaxID=764103 RepID=G7DZ34_MIXOS|nr:uncharacterized protein L969DRAFT_95343 [Mixia osmundae IAM 14324]KEI38245.1 hypothetical protein L969DRAFT_95343 [Mixia osmundae IAM 14324]GAA95844.1 hypothetical protein E5Q_02501 [Mixia osmundae IAM 14324]
MSIKSAVVFLSFSSLSAVVAPPSPPASRCYGLTANACVARCSFHDSGHTFACLSPGVEHTRIVVSPSRYVTTGMMCAIRSRPFYRPAQCTNRQWVSDPSQSYARFDLSMPARLLSLEPDPDDEAFAAILQECCVTDWTLGLRASFSPVRQFSMIQNDINVLCGPSLSAASPAYCRDHFVADSKPSAPCSLEAHPSAQSERSIVGSCSPMAQDLTLESWRDDYD